MKTMKRRNYGVFVYSKNDENTKWEHMHNKRDAIELAKELSEHLELGEYVEVWKEDDEGLFGNSGMPLYKSDGYTELA